jgi:hypothetical protein
MDPMHNIIKISPIALLFTLAISVSANVWADVQPKPVNFKGLGWTDLRGGYDKEIYELGNLCYNLPTTDKKRFRFPTKSELQAIIQAHKLNIIGQPSKYGIWTRTEEPFTFDDGNSEEQPVRCTLEGACDNNPYEEGATEHYSVPIKADVVCVIELEENASSQPVKNDDQQGKSSNPLTTSDAEMKTKGRIVKELAYSSQLDRNQLSTWCQRRVPELGDSFSSGPNKLISIGECTCKVIGAVSMEEQYQCEFPYSYRDFTDNAQLAENTQRSTKSEKPRAKKAAAVSQAPVLTRSKETGITAEKKTQSAVEKLLTEKEAAEDKEKQKLEEKRPADFNKSQKRHNCRHIITATGNAYTEADARSQIHLEASGKTGVTGLGDPYQVASSAIICKKQTTQINPEYKCIGKQVNNVSQIGECGSSADSQGSSK